MRFQAVLLGVLCSASLSAWTPDDMLKVKTVSDVQVSPDGHDVAFTVTRHDLVKSEPVSQVWVARADGVTHREFQLTQGAYQASSPRWSPDGRWIVFGAMVDASGGAFVVSSEGGTPRRLTAPSVSALVFGWSRDGK